MPGKGGERMEENKFDLSGAVEKLQEMMGSESGKGQLQSIIQMFASDSEGNLEHKGGFGGLGSGGVTDPESLEMLFKLQQAMTVMKNSKSDDNVRFLQSLKPYLKERRQSKIDSAVKMLRLSKVIEVMKETNG